jgi:hypothetical protein
MTTRLFKTPTKERRERRNLALCTEYSALVGVEGQSKTQVVSFLMSKFGIGSQSTIYAILKEGGAL